MLDAKFITAEFEKVKTSYEKRNKPELLPLLNQVIDLDKQRRTSLQEVEALKAKRNQASVEIAKLKKEKKDDPALMESMKAVAAQIKGQDEKVAEIEAQLAKILLELPNWLQDDVPRGKSSEENVEILKWPTEGPKPLPFPAKSHDEIGEKLGIIDFKKAGDVTGARFVFLKGMAARLEMALIQFMYDCHIANGYEPILPPYLVNRASLTGTGQLPKFEEDVFHIEKFDFFLTPTAEVPVTNYYRGEIVDEKELTKSFVAFSPCFRSEAGSYGKDTKGLKRQHQFHKVELVKFATQEKSEEELEKMVVDAESVLKALKLPYRRMKLCGGDVGFASRKTYDLEVWSPNLNGYMEISSCSNCGDFQARRANVRYRDKQGKVQFMHTLNGSGLAVGRTLLAIIENYQTADGNFTIPDALKPYIRG